MGHDDGAGEDARGPRGSGTGSGIGSGTGPAIIEAGYVVDATGRRASFARGQGARRIAVDHLVGVTAFLTPSAGPLADATALIEAVREGWWYSAVLPDGRLATALFTDADLLAARPVRSDAEWRARLRGAIHTQARVAACAYHLTVPPRVAAAGSARLDPIAGEGWLAVGDAAASHDPLSGHGIGSSLAAGIQAAEAIAGATAGDAIAPIRYADRQRRAFDRYLALRRAYYAAEPRWPGAPFWRRRLD